MTAHPSAATEHTGEPQLAAAHSSAATEHTGVLQSSPERRFARDGNAYTENEFKDFYGGGYKNQWSCARVYESVVYAGEAAISVGKPGEPAAQDTVQPWVWTPSAATEHTGEPQLAAAHSSAATEHTGVPQLAGAGARWLASATTAHTSNATEHAGAVPSSGELQIVATEHDDAPDILFTIDDAAEIRRTFKGQPGVLHTEARRHLDEITDSLMDYGADEVHRVADSIRWKEYIAMHKDWKDIIANGIVAAYCEKIHHTRDPNRGNRERVDYIFYRPNNTYCRVHPGTKPKHDAQLYFGETSTCSRALQAYEVAPNPLTLQAAMQIPMNDKMGKAEAWRQLSERDDASIDVTEHDPFKWWLFLSNLGPNTPKAIGTGITSVQIHKRENKIGLRTEHTDSSEQWVILTPHRASYKTQLATCIALLQSVLLYLAAFIAAQLCYRASYYMSPAIRQSQLCTGRR